MSENFKKELLAFGLGMLIGGSAFYYLTNFIFHNHASHNHYALEGTEKYHIHADFIIKTRDTIHDLGTTELSSTAENILSPSAHLHDENGKVLHMHAADFSFVDFLKSLKINLSADCLLIENKSYCNSDNEKISLWVNGNLWEKPFSEYIPSDLDKILLYFGPEDFESLKDDLSQVSDDACIYSGSCKERGVAPPESCGLTCEL